jgi:transcriptional regulator with XRE-family HTH domain
MHARAAPMLLPATADELRDRHGKFCTEGRRALRVRGDRQATLAARLGCAQQAVSQLLSGDLLPGLRLAVAIEKATGIACQDWLIPPRVAPSVALQVGLVSGRPRSSP